MRTYTDTDLGSAAIVGQATLAAGQHSHSGRPKKRHKAPAGDRDGAASTSTYSPGQLGGVHTWIYLAQVMLDHR
jgi:hypothetical protein